MPSSSAVRKCLSLARLKREKRWWFTVSERLVPSRPFDSAARFRYPDHVSSGSTKKCLASRRLPPSFHLDSAYVSRAYSPSSPPPSHTHPPSRSQSVDVRAMISSACHRRGGCTLILYVSVCIVMRDEEGELHVEFVFSCNRGRCNLNHDAGITNTTMLRYPTIVRDEMRFACVTGRRSV